MSHVLSTMPTQQQPNRPAEAPTPTPQTPPAAPTLPSPKAAIDYAAAQARYNEFVNQLRNAERRRENVVQELQRTGQTEGRAAVVQRLANVDKQILQLEADVTEAGRLLAQTPPPYNATTRPPPSRNNDDGLIVLSGLSIMFVLAPLAFAAARRLWKRPVATAILPAWSETPGRLERLETAVDTIALEIERISESQRFMTRLMTETQLGSAVASVRASADAARDEIAEPMAAPSVKALGAGERPFDPINVADREELRIRRDA